MVPTIGAQGQQEYTLVQCPGPPSAQRTSLPNDGFGISNLVPNSKPLRLAHVAITADVGPYRGPSSRCFTQWAEKEPHSGTNSPSRSKITPYTSFSTVRVWTYTGRSTDISSPWARLSGFQGGCICRLDCTLAACGGRLYFLLSPFLFDPAHRVSSVWGPVVVDLGAFSTSLPGCALFFTQTSPKAQWTAGSSLVSQGTCAEALSQGCVAKMVSRAAGWM